MLHVILALCSLLRRACSVVLWMANWILYRRMIAIVPVCSADRGALVDVLALGAACLGVGDVGCLAWRCAAGVCAGKDGCED
jgi:hypothetical protein